MDRPFPDIGKTITNNILPSNFTQYVSGDTTILSIGGSRLFLCISVSRYSLIRIGLYKVVVLEIIKPISEKNRFNSMNHVGTF